MSTLTQDEITTILDQVVIKKTKPFCYGCYIEVTKTSHCPKCGTDDFMRLLDGFGCEYGTEPFFEPILEEIGADNCEFENDADAHEEFLDDIYGDEVKIGWLTKNTGALIRELDPIAFQMSMDEQTNSLIDDGQIVEIGNKHYYVDQLTELLEGEL